jgi:hypothetical protein
MGIVEVTCLAVRAAAVPPVVTMRSTVETNEFSDVGENSILAEAGPPVFDRDVRALHVAQIAEPRRKASSRADGPDRCER